MKWIRLSFSIGFLLFCFNAYSETSFLGQSRDHLNALAANPHSAMIQKNTLFNTRCWLMMGNMDDAKSEMNKKNSLFRNACSLYQSWIDLFRQSNCKDPDKEVPENFSCETAIASTCQEIDKLENEAWGWMSLGFQNCVPEFWQSGCQKLNNASSQCQAVRCPDRCQIIFDCSLESFLITLRTNPYQDKSECIRSTEKMRIR